MVIAATGFFDGVHLGHKSVIGRLVSLARESSGESVVLTFWPHPRNVLQQEASSLRLLTSLEEKKKMLLELGVDRVEVLQFTKQFGRMTAGDYLADIVRGRMGASAVLLGYDNRLGSDMLCGEQLRNLALSLGMEAYFADKVDSGSGAAVSSTLIRKAISLGDILSARQMLGYDYSLYGVVVSGNRLGRTIGFPTANMQLYEPLKLLPANGVYEVRVETCGGTFRGMCNIGVRPTVSRGDARTIETHILDFDEDIYGLDMRIHFVRRIREEKKFSSMEELKRQLESDKKYLEYECR